MQDYVSPPWMTEPKARADRFLPGAKKRFSDGGYMLWQAVIFYWLHFRIESSCLRRKGWLTLLGLVGFRQQKENATCNSPVVDGGRGDSQRQRQPAGQQTGRKLKEVYSSQADCHCWDSVNLY